MKDEEAAAAHYEKMRTLAEDKCAEGKARECASLGWFYLGGKATRPDYKKAAEYSQKACKLGNYLACGNLGEQYEHGLGVKKNPGKAFRFCKKGCDSGSGYACARLGQMHEFGKGTRKNQARARSLYEKSCRLGSAEGCALVEIDKTGPAGISETECASKPTACWKLGLQHIFARGTQRDLVKGTELLRTACSNGEWRACDLAIDFGEMP
jgi:uncharacterized protein